MNNKSTMAVVLKTASEMPCCNSYRRRPTCDAWWWRFNGILIAETGTPNRRRCCVSE